MLLLHEELEAFMADRATFKKYGGEAFYTGEHKSTENAARAEIHRAHTTELENWIVRIALKAGGGLDLKDPDKALLKKKRRSTQQVPSKEAPRLILQHWCGRPCGKLLSRSLIGQLERRCSAARSVRPRMPRMRRLPIKRQFGGRAHRCSLDQCSTALWERLDARNSWPVQRPCMDPGRNRARSTHGLVLFGPEFLASDEGLRKRPFGLSLGVHMYVALPRGLLRFSRAEHIERSSI